MCLFLLFSQQKSLPEEGYFSQLQHQFPLRTKKNTHANTHACTHTHANYTNCIRNQPTETGFRKKQGLYSFIIPVDLRCTTEVKSALLLYAQRSCPDLRKILTWRHPRIVLRRTAHPLLPSPTPLLLPHHSRRPNLPTRSWSLAQVVLHMQKRCVIRRSSFGTGLLSKRNTSRDIPVY